MGKLKIEKDNKDINQLINYQFIVVCKVISTKLNT